MLSKEQIKLMDSKNISINKEHTKKVFASIWNSTTNRQKKKVVELGGYQDSKPCNNTKNTGSISVRMALAMSIVFGLDPFYLIGMKGKDEGFEEKIQNDFLRYFAFDEFVIEEQEDKNILKSNNRNMVITNEKAELFSYINGIMQSADLSNENLLKISDEELKILFDSIIVQSKLNKSEAILKMTLIKLILIS